MNSIRTLRGKFGAQTLLWIACAMLLQAPLFAQFSGTISGYIHDPSGAAISGANVIATTTDQGTSRSAPTDSTGFYNFVSMPRGNYVITASAPGFQTRTIKGVELTAGGNVREDFAMTVGQVTQEVTVTSSAPMVETSTSTESYLVDDRRVQDLPLNGRNIIALTLTMSNVNGVSAPQTMGDSRSGPLASINGSNQTANYYTLNGANFMNWDQATSFNPPPPDAIQEIRIQSHNFPAEYGFTNGAQITMATKSGSRQFHGTAWEFYRGAALNARSYFQTKRPGQVQNQPGFTAGGPIKGFGGKLFYFGSYQQLWNRQQAGSSSVSLPTTAQRGGDFSALLPGKVLTNPNNPLTGLPLTNSTGQPCVANNVINSGCLSSAAQKIMTAYFPAGATSVTTLTPSPINNHSFLGRLDYNLSAKNLLFVDFNFDHTDNSSLAGNISYITQSVYTNIAQGEIHDTHTFSPNLINEGLVAYTYNKAKGGPNSVVQPSSLGVNVPLDPSGGRGLTASITGGPNLAYPGITYQYYNQFEYNDAVTWIHGRHTMKFGYQGLWSFFWYQLALTRSLTFSGVETGNAFADFVLGRFDTGTFNYGAADNSPIGWKHALFAEDTYKVSPRFTLEYGIRWEPFTPFTQKSGRDLSFIPGQKSVVRPNSPPGILFIGDKQVPQKLEYPVWNTFAPRLGLSWDVFGNQKTVVRAAAGTFFQADGGEQLHASQGPWEGTDVLRNGLLDDPFGSLNQPMPPTQAALPGDFGCTAISAYPYMTCTFGQPITFVYTVPHFKVPTSEHFTLNIQQQLSRNWALELAYVGQPTFNQMGHNQFNAARNITVPDPNDPKFGQAPTAQNVNDRVTYSPGLLSPQSRVLGSFYHSHYQGGSVSVRSAVIHGFSINAGYTRAKILTNIGDIGTGLTSTVPNPFDLNWNRAPSFFDVRNTLAISWVYSPKVTLSNRLLKGVLEDWTITGLHRVQSGTPLQFLMGSDIAQNGSNYANSAQIAQYAAGMNASNLPISHANRKALIAAYFNTGAFQAPKTIAAGTYGNVRRGAMYGPGYVDHDFSVMRQVSLGFEDMKLQIRGEFFNAFNDVNFNNPNVTASGASFGQIQGANAGRVIQVAGKIIW